jgi:hypothetical protein
MRGLKPVDIGEDAVATLVTASGECAYFDLAEKAARPDCFGRDRAGTEPQCMTSLASV